MTSTHHFRCIFPEDACKSASRPHQNVGVFGHFRIRFRSFDRRAAAA